MNEIKFISIIKTKFYEILQAYENQKLNNEFELIKLNYIKLINIANNNCKLNIINYCNKTIDELIELSILQNDPIDSEIINNYIELFTYQIKKLNKFRETCKLITSMVSFSIISMIFIQ